MKRIIAILIAFMIAASAPVTAQVSIGGSSSSTQTKYHTFQGGYVAIVFDDGRRDVWLNRSLFTSRGFPLCISVIARNPLYGDTNVSVMSAEQLRYAHDHYGWEIGAHGYSHHDSIFANKNGAIAQGTSGAASLAVNDMLYGRTVMIDSLGLVPTYWSGPFNSNEFYEDQALWPTMKVGINPVNLATGYSTQGERGNVDWIGTIFHYGMSSLATNERLSLLPGRLPAPTRIPQTLSESTSYPGYRTRRIIKYAISRQGAVVFIGHKPSVWDVGLGGSGTGTLDSLAAFLDFCKSYVNAGKLKVVTLSTLYDEFYVRKIHPAFNFVRPNFEDLDQDGKIDLLYTSSYLGIYRDSTAANGAKNPGYDDEGYVTLNWTGLGVAAGGIMGHSVDRAWKTRAFEYQIPVPAGGGWVAHVEFFAQIDTTSYTPAGDDTIGVVFAAGWDRQWNRWGSSPAEAFDPGNHGGFMSYTSSINLTSGTDPGNKWFLNYRDKIGDAWLHCEATWPVPDRAEILHVNIWKGGRVPPGAIRVSKVFIGFYKREPGDWWQ